MASSLPESYAFSLLSRLPPASFVVEQRDFEVSVQPSGGVYASDREHVLEIYLRGAPNEVCLMGYATIQASTSITADFSAVALPNNAEANALTQKMVRRAFFQNDVNTRNVRWEKGPVIFNSSRESVNASQLPILDNQDKASHLVLNNARCLVSKRQLSRGLGNKADTTFDYYSQEIKALGSAGWNDDSAYKGINLWYQMSAAALPAGRPFRKVDNGVKNWNIPLGLYSSLAASHTVLPIGLLSSYSVNGYGIRLTLANLCDPNNGLVKGLALDARRADTWLFQSPNPYGAAIQPVYGFDTLTGVLRSVKGDGTRNVKISVPVVKILDPAVMSSLLALYEKRQSVNVGGVNFPLSLRMNTLGYRTYDFALSGGQSDMFHRLPTTDRSVRAVMCMLYDTGADKVPIQRGGVNCNKWTRLDVKVGSLTPLGTVLENRTPYDTNIETYFANSIKRSGHCFSAYPYWQEVMEKTVQSADQYGVLIPTQESNQQVLQLGVISFENMDYREGDMQTALQASGVDCTNVGAIDINVRITHFANDYETNNYDSGPVANASPDAEFGVGSQGVGPAVGQWRMLYVLAYDQVFEASPSGVTDITNAVL